MEICDGEVLYTARKRECKGSSTVQVLGHVIVRPAFCGSSCIFSAGRTRKRV
jgi:hypothetical protein